MEVVVNNEYLIPYCFNFPFIVVCFRLEFNGFASPNDKWRRSALIWLCSERNNIILFLLETIEGVFVMKGLGEGGRGGRGRLGSLSTRPPKSNITIANIEQFPLATGMNCPRIIKP